MSAAQLSPRGTIGLRSVALAQAVSEGTAVTYTASGARVDGPITRARCEPTRHRSGQPDLTSVARTVEPDQLPWGGDPNTRTRSTPGPVRNSGESTHPDCRPSPQLRMMRTACSPRARSSPPGAVESCMWLSSSASTSAAGPASTKPRTSRLRKRPARFGYALVIRFRLAGHHAAAAPVDRLGHIPRYHPRSRSGPYSLSIYKSMSSAGTAASRRVRLITAPGSPVCGHGGPAWRGPLGWSGPYGQITCAWLDPCRIGPCPHHSQPTAGTTVGFPPRYWRR